jgi:hypothetical protein
MSISLAALVISVDGPVVMVFYWLVLACWPLFHWALPLVGVLPGVFLFCFSFSPFSLSPGLCGSVLVVLLSLQ